MKISNLFTSPDGTLSRTQSAIVIQTVLAITLILCEVIWGGVLTSIVLIAQGGLFVFAIIDRMDARHIDFKISKEGAHITMKGDKQ